MTAEFKEVDEQDFITFTAGVTPSYVLIERHLIEIGGGGKHGTEYKQEVLRNAGWKYKALTSYGSHSELATGVFNSVRKVLMEVDSAADILERSSELAVGE